MSGSILINFDHQINGSISITLPMPNIIIQFPGQINDINTLCTCGQNSQFQATNNIKQEQFDIKEELIEIKEEMVDINEEMVDIKEELFDYDVTMEEYILNKDINLYQNMFSPISVSESENEESNDTFVEENQDEHFNTWYKRNFEDLFEVMEYLQQGGF